MTSHCYILALLSYLTIPFSLGLRVASCMLISHTLWMCSERVCHEIWLNRQDLQGGSLGLPRLLLQGSRHRLPQNSRTVANQKLDLNEKFLPKLILKTHFSTRQELSSHTGFLGRAVWCIWKPMAIMSSREC